MTSNELMRTAKFKVKSINCTSELKQVFEKELNINPNFYGGRFWVLGRAIMIMDASYVYLFKNLSNARVVCKIKTPVNFPYCEDTTLEKFASEVIEKYNYNYNKFC